MSDLLTNAVLACPAVVLRKLWCPSLAACTSSCGAFKKLTRKDRESAPQKSHFWGEHQLAIHWTAVLLCGEVEYASTQLITTFNHWTRPKLDSTRLDLVKLNSPDEQQTGNLGIGDTHHKRGVTILPGRLPKKHFGHGQWAKWWLYTIQKKPIQNIQNKI